MCISTTTAARSDGHRAKSVWGAIVQLLTGCLVGSEEAHVRSSACERPATGQRPWSRDTTTRGHSPPWLSHRFPLWHEPLGGLVRLRGGPGLAPPGALPPDPTRRSVDSVAPAERRLVALGFQIGDSGWSRSPNRPRCPRIRWRDHERGNQCDRGGRRERGGLPAVPVDRKGTGLLVLRGERRVEKMEHL
jgi:hypothetical protein